MTKQTSGRAATAASSSNGVWLRLGMVGAAVTGAPFDGAPSKGALSWAGVRGARLTALSALALLLASGCGDDKTTAQNPAVTPDGTTPQMSPTSSAGGSGNTPGSTETTAVAPQPAVANPTFWQDAEPIFNNKCVGCHQEGGIGPFRLDDFDTARQYANIIRDYTKQRIMPPYLLETGGKCGSFDESAALTDAQIETIGNWVDTGTPEGTPVTMTPPALATLDDATEWQTPAFTPQIQGGALAQFDEYRCFRMDMNLPSEKWVTGSEVVPGNKSIVHHVLGFVIDPDAASMTGMSNGQLMDQMDAESPDRDGWPCFADAGPGIKVESVPVGWAPGFGANPYPDGLGVRVPQGRQLVIQVHYNMANPTVIGQSDQTLIKLRLADKVERQAIFVLRDAMLGSLESGSPVTLPPGETHAQFTSQETVAQLLGGQAPPIPLDLIAITPHMHGRGQTYTLELGKNGQDGDFDCIGRVDHWDFNWQRQYNYVKRPALSGTDLVRLTCEYDTSSETQAVSPGWGTRNEMCTNAMMIAFPPGFFP